jgi:hypothetical protein
LEDLAFGTLSFKSVECFWQARERNRSIDKRLHLSGIDEFGETG